MKPSCIQNQGCEYCSRNVAWVGIGTNVLLVFLKLFVGISSGSKGCIADALHSASNIITSFAILISRRVAKKPTTSDFHFGFGKVEFLAAAFVSLLIVCCAILLIVLSIKHLLREPATQPHFSAALVSILSIGCSEMLFRYMRCVGNRLNSQTILASASANRADCFSSVAVLVGVIGARMGIPHMDPIAALVVVAVIIKISTVIMRDSLRALMDGSVNALYSEEIKNVVMKINGVYDVEELKTRQIGRTIWAELDILIDPLHSLRNGHHIAQMVRETLLSKVRDLERVTVHIKPLRTE